MKRTKTALMVPIAAILLIAASVAGAPRQIAKASFGNPFVIRGGQEITVGALKIRMTVGHQPIERAPNGLELFPYTYYRLEWQEGTDSLVIPRAIRCQKGQPNSQVELFGRYTFTFEERQDEDEAAVTVFKRWCLLRYTSSNQLRHGDGRIIFDTTEDFCCYYSDGKNNCDLRASRVEPPRVPDARYCVLYSNQRKGEQNCCCRFEKGEALDPACQAQCDRLTADGK